MKITGDQEPSGICRRDFLRGTGTAAVIGGAFLPLSDVSLAAESPSVLQPNLVNGNILRTQGKVSLTGSTFVEQQREIPIVGRPEVIVCGGGPAGVAAALSAARAGAKVQLIELAGCLGGTWTAGLLTKIIDAGNKGGIMKELCQAFAKEGSQTAKRTGGTVYDPEVAKLVLEEKLTEAGVVLRYHTRVVGAVTNKDKRLTAIVTESKSGREAWTADCFVDCTGDGDLAAQAGCEFDVGIDESGTCQPMSMLALLTGIDQKTYGQYTKGRGRETLLKLMNSLGMDPSYRAPTLRHLHGGIFSIMTNHEYGVPAFDANAITQATIRSRKELNELVNGLRKEGGTFKDVALVATAEHIGIREGRRIKGRYQITRQDIIEGMRHKEAVCRATFSIDVHGLSKTEPAFRHADKNARAKPYDIPYPALVAADVTGLLMAGRNISGDFIAHASYRVTGNAVPMGEAAGLAAAASVQKGRLPHELSWQEINSHAERACEA